MLICGNFPSIPYNTTQAGIGGNLSSTDSLRICQTGQGISFYPPLHGIIPTIFENAKNGRKKTGNLFLISCLSVPFCMYDGYSVFNWLQFYK